MNAQPVLAQIAQALAAVKLEAVLIGNAAAALQGAPVTTLDFDFCFRATEANERKIQTFARMLDATVSRPHEPVSSMVRVENDDISMQVDFLPDKHIGMNMASLRSRATRVSVAGHTVLVADLEDVAAGKRKANRAKDKAALYVIETVIEEKKRR
jgi:predicted nucleotidyltransferase